MFPEAIEGGPSRVFRVQSREGLEYRSVLCISYYQTKSVLRKSIQNNYGVVHCIKVFRIGGSTVV